MVRSPVLPHANCDAAHQYARLPRCRAILHDPAIYPDPYVFDPERYLRKADDGLNPDPRDYAFGYGRRSVVRLPSP